MSKILYFRADLTAESPLIIGSGIDDNTDSDILIGGDGKPYIPGTTLAGVCRHYLLKKFGGEKTKITFGYNVFGKDESKNSSIIFYDAQLKDDGYSVTIRDGVKLDGNKNTVIGGKFDYEIIEAGSAFYFKVELRCMDENFALDIINEIVSGFNSHELRVGAKTNRGFGKIQTNEEKIKIIDLNTQMQEYIEFTWDDVNGKYTKNELETSQYKTWKIEFDLQSFLFVRNYATTKRMYDPKIQGNTGKIVGAEQLLNKDANPVIPGTSWAGAFRSHFVRLLNKVDYMNPNDLTDKVFGYAITEGAKKGETRPSKIIFSESVIKNSHQLNRTRNAIDRFTGGAGDKKLFTTRPAYRGSESKGNLEIKLRKNDFSSNEFALIVSIIDTCIADLNAGFLTVGGEASTGGGLIKVVKKRCE